MSSNSDNLFSGLVGQAINKAIDSTNEKNNSAAIRLGLAIAGILFFVGAEAVKIVFRKNFGVKGIKMPQLILCLLCFLGIGIMAITQYLNPGKLPLGELGGSEFSFLLTGIFYITLAGYMLRKAIIERIRAMQNQAFNDFTGEADLLSVLAEKGWSQNSIHYLAEPLYCIVLGAVLYFYNPFGAIPLVFCGLSVWAHFIMELIFMQNPLQPQMQSQTQQPPKPGAADTNF